VPDAKLFAAGEEQAVGVVSPSDGSLRLNEGRPTTSLSVTNTDDRPIQVGSHFHFVETNPRLRFDRDKAYGKRLDIPAGTAIRFEPGETKTVTLVDIAGNQVIRGGNKVADGAISSSNKSAAMERIKSRGFANQA
jgi:urease subunit gamma/beta